MNTYIRISQNPDGSCAYTLASRRRVLFRAIATSLEDKQEVHRVMDRIINSRKKRVRSYGNQERVMMPKRLITAEFVEKVEAPSR